MNAFDKVIGYKSIRRELLQVCDMIRNRAIYEEMGARLPHGLLLYGDPGLGKTLLAKCFTEESGLNTITVRRDQGGDAFVNSITQAFAKAKAEAPAILFLDDMDKFANEDDSRCDAPEYVAVQAGIDDVKETEVFVIATANEIRKLPDSLLRSGRFDRKIGVYAPSAADAEAIIAHYLTEKRISDDINMKDLTMMMSYHSCAELETILNEAAVRAAFARKESIGMEDITSTVLKQQYGAQEEISHVANEILEKVALHEAGHLVVSEILCPGSVGFASLLPSRENRCGGFVHNCKVLPDSYEAIIGLGGKAAVEMRYAGQIADGCASDIKRVVNRIREATAKEGTLGFSLLDVESGSSAGMSESLNARSEAAVQMELERCYNKAKNILSANQAFFEKITEAFLEKKTLLYSDIQSIHGAFAKEKSAPGDEAASGYDSSEEPSEDEKVDELKQRILRRLEEHRRNQYC
ncbi:AAA family ATPase [Flintibacter faecis]|uniref:AAA family ATPase n=1 Tax=Flintibacter faecis TaxID=2763047 RepID=A0A8J6J2P4_9FIRM|nr:AAA family ATPase [Flintibacter faecis]MBC5716017.1 AAA family ATPase [Flintibacter faecis]